MAATIKKIVKLIPAAVRRKLPKKISIISIGERQAATLNRRYRKKNPPANVLSFRYGPDYGEIVLCPSVIRSEAKKQGNSYSFQKKWMIIHGFLHLAGVHHEKSRQAQRRFERLEQKLLKGK